MILEEGLTKLGLLQDNVQKLLTLFIEEIELFNPAYGLVKVQDRRELIVKHIFDSLAPLSIMQDFIGNKNGVCKIADVGSGAGLPGIPLAVCMPNAEFTLIERMERRAGFLRDAIAIMGLSNVRVAETEMEKFPVSEEDRFDLAVFRAFTRLDPGILKGLLRLLTPAGALAAYKGRSLTIEEEMAQLQSALTKDNLPWKIIPLDVPFLEEERHLVIISKAVSNGH